MFLLVPMQEQTGTGLWRAAVHEVTSVPGGTLSKQQFQPGQQIHRMGLMMGLMLAEPPLGTAQE